MKAAYAVWQPSSTAVYLKQRLPTGSLCVEIFSAFLMKVGGYSLHSSLHSLFLLISSEPYLQQFAFQSPLTSHPHLFSGLSSHVFCRKNLQALGALQSGPAQKGKNFQRWLFFFFWLNRKWPFTGLEKSQDFCPHFRFLLITTITPVNQKGKLQDTRFDSLLSLPFSLPPSRSHFQIKRYLSVVSCQRSENQFIFQELKILPSIHSVLTFWVQRRKSISFLWLTRDWNCSEFIYVFSMLGKWADPTLQVLRQGNLLVVDNRTRLSPKAKAHVGISPWGTSDICK